MPTVAIVYYSMYGHIRTMADVIKDSLEANGCEVKLYQVPETLPKEVLEKMHAPAKRDDPVATPDDLVAADGILFGIPTRFGMAAAQMKAFLDSTGGLWQSQALAGKPAGIFVSTATQSGGQETTALTFITQLAHHGMVFVPLGYASPLAFDLESPHGGGPFGSGTFAGPDGSRQPSEIEKGMATKQGEVFAKVVKKLAVEDKSSSTQIAKAEKKEDPPTATKKDDPSTTQKGEASRETGAATEQPTQSVPAPKSKSCCSCQ